MASPASAALFLATLTLGGGAVAGQQARSCPASKELGSVAYVDTPEVKWPKPDRGGSLRVLNLDTCRVRVLVPRGAQPPVRWSHDGRWLAFGNGRVVAASGGEPTHPLDAVVKWTWAPGRDVLAGITARGGVILGGPRISVKRLLRDGSRVDNVAFDGSGQRLAVAQDRPSELSVFDLGSGEQTVLRRFSSWYAGVTVAGWSPNGRWVLFWGPYAGASIAADGVPLHAIPASGGRVATLAKWMLLYHDFISWCGTRLVASVGPIRDSTLGKYLVTAKPPRWRAARLVRSGSRSWVSPACSPDDRWIAAAAGRNFGARFGLEHRSLWLLPTSGGSPRRLTVAPAGATDESPRWSRDGRSLLFVRTRHFFGHLYLVRRSGALTGPLASVGWNPPYYGTYGWADQLDWYQAH